MNTLFRIKSFASYLLRRKSKHSIHSPFVFTFITDILRDKTKYGAYAVMDQIRKRTFADSNIIETIDFGALSQSNQADVIQVRTGSLARKRSNPKWVYNFLYRLTLYFKPAAMLELGTSVGFSSISFALANTEGKLYTLEGCPSVAKVAKVNFDQLKLENIHIITGHFNETIPAALSQFDKLDFVFFDGNHRKEPTLNYFMQCLGKCHEHSVFIFDDIHWSPGMEEAWNQICTHPKVSLSVDLFQLGLVFFHKGISKQHFTI